MASFEWSPACRPFSRIPSLLRSGGCPAKSKSRRSLRSTICKRSRIGRDFSFTVSTNLKTQLLVSARQS
jgi:hypothetical protein